MKWQNDCQYFFCVAKCSDLFRPNGRSANRNIQTLNRNSMESKTCKPNEMSLEFFPSVFMGLSKKMQSRLLIKTHISLLRISLFLYPLHRFKVSRRNHEYSKIPTKIYCHCHEFSILIIQTKSDLFSAVVRLLFRMV